MALGVGVVDVGVDVGVSVGVVVGVGEEVGGGLALGVALAVGVGVGLGVGDGVGVSDGVDVGLGVGVGLRVADAVGDGVGVEVGEVVTTGPGPAVELRSRRIDPRTTIARKRTAAPATSQVVLRDHVPGGRGASGVDAGEEAAANASRAPTTPLPPPDAAPGPTPGLAGGAGCAVDAETGVGEVGVGAVVGAVVAAVVAAVVMPVPVVAPEAGVRSSNISPSMSVA